MAGRVRNERVEELTVVLNLRAQRVAYDRKSSSGDVPPRDVTTVLLVRPNRLVGLLALAVDLGLLASVIASINVGLFGFKESLSGPFVVESIVIEAMAAAALSLWIATGYTTDDESHPKPVGTRPEDPGANEEEFWIRLARQAEADSDDLAHALDFHLVSECDCHGAADVATLRRHDIRAISREAMPSRKRSSAQSSGQWVPGLRRPRLVQDERRTH